MALPKINPTTTKSWSNLQEHFKHFVGHELSHHLGSISEILFFLLGAMTIVELVDAHQGFRIITDRITTKNTVKLLWIVSIITFFLSSVLDNLTTSIVMVSLLRKLIKEAEQRKPGVGCQYVLGSHVRARHDFLAPV